MNTQSHLKNETNEHYRRVGRVLAIVLVLNWAVAAAKIIYGLLSRVGSMTADGYHSLSDGTSNIIGLIGIFLASRPKDLNHPYGHKKYETFFSLGIAGLLFLVALNLVRQGINRFLHPVAFNIDFQSFLVMVVTIGINIAVTRYEYRKGKLYNSDILIADSMHTKADIFTSFSVIIALIGIKLGYPVIDPLITLFIAVFVGYAGYEILKQSSDVLCDAVATVDTKKIEEIVLSVQGVRSFHKIRTRGRTDDVYIDLHIQLDPDTHLDKAHQISSIIEDKVKKSIPGVSELLVHLEPKEK